MLVGLVIIIQDVSQQHVTQQLVAEYAHSVHQICVVPVLLGLDDFGRVRVGFAQPVAYFFAPLLHLLDEGCRVQELELGVFGEDCVDESEHILPHQLVIIVHVHHQVVGLAVVLGVLVLLAVVAILDVLDDLQFALLQRVAFHVLVHFLSALIVVQVVHFELRVVLGQQ